jgi:putative membrane protein
MISPILSALSGLEHFYILYLECFQWNTKKTNKIFGLKPEFASQPQAYTMAANQGLYNGFLAVALVLGYQNSSFLVYGNACVAVAAVVGAMTVHPRILYVQGTLSLAALATYYLGY